MDSVSVRISSMDESFIKYFVSKYPVIQFSAKKSETIATFYTDKLVVTLQAGELRFSHNQLKPVLDFLSEIYKFINGAIRFRINYNVPSGDVRNEVHRKLIDNRYTNRLIELSGTENVHEMDISFRVILDFTIPDKSILPDVENILIEIDRIIAAAVISANIE